MKNKRHDDWGSRCIAHTEKIKSYSPIEFLYLRDGGVPVRIVRDCEGALVLNAYDMTAV